MRFHLRYIQQCTLHGLLSPGILIVALSVAGAFTACQPSDSATNEDTSTTAKDSANSGEDMTNASYIVFYGNSLTAGYQLEEDRAFPALIQRRIDSLGYDYTVVNAGLSGETSAGGAGRIDWVMQQPVDIFVLELGANDALRGLDLTATKENLRAILDRVVEVNPNVELIIAGMKAPPNMGPEYTREFNAIFPALAREHDAGLIPFLLAGVASQPELNLEDGIHPNVEGHKIVMENVWTVLKDYL